jgi:peptidyl-prolyl cis-trans isomerase SurA
MKKTLFFAALLLASSFAFGQKNILKKELLNIDGQKITAGKFLKIYEKNGTEGQDTTSLKDYLQLYINFRLKVLEAENQKMDTMPAFRRELKSYRKQLARPYFTDERVTDSLVKQAYQRLQYDIRASHILIRVSPNASPADTLKAWNKINRIREEILHGMDFSKAADKYSQDPSARDQKAIPGRQRGRRGNHGDLGYFSVFNMVYPFEEKAYNTPVDSVSKPVRTRFGYHLIKVTDKKPAMGVAEVEHIYVALPPGSTQKDSLAKAQKIQNIYQKIKAGMPFEEAAKKYSEDRGSAGRGGRLPRFTSGRIVPQFVEQIDKLQPGQISKPFQTIYGFHIIKLINRKRPGTFAQEESKLKEKTERDQRAEKSKEAVLAKIKKTNNLRIYQDAKKAVFQAIDSSTLLQGKFRTDSVPGKWNNALMELGKTHPKVWVQKDFLAYVEKHQHGKKYHNKSVMLNRLFRQFTDDNCLQYENDHLEDFYPDFKALMQEYHDGILLFNLMDKMVWTKAMQDTVGLKKYFQAHRQKYRHGTEAEAVIFSSPKSKLPQLDSLLKRYPDKIKLYDDLHSGKIKLPWLSADSGTFQKGDNQLLSRISWKEGLSEPVPSDVENKVSVIFIKKIIPPGEMSFEQARGLVVSDYQDVLEKTWVQQLRKKYPVRVNEKVLKKLQNYYDKQRTKS